MVSKPKYRQNAAGKWIDAKGRFVSAETVQRFLAEKALEKKATKKASKKKTGKKAPKKKTAKKAPKKKAPKKKTGKKAAKKAAKKAPKKKFSKSRKPILTVEPAREQKPGKAPSGRRRKPKTRQPKKPGPDRATILDSRWERMVTDGEFFLRQLAAHPDLIRNPFRITKYRNPDGTGDLELRMTSNDFSRDIEALFEAWNPPQSIESLWCVFIGLFDHTQDKRTTGAFPFYYGHEMVVPYKIRKVKNAPIMFFVWQESIEPNLEMHGYTYTGFVITLHSGIAIPDYL